MDWALLTSSNLSKQAWGEAVQTTGVCRIASWEIGVLVWPDLLADDGQTAVMVPTFQSDRPEAQSCENDGKQLVGIRVPYNMPLQPYGSQEVPWVVTMKHTEPDNCGRIWG